MTHNRREQLAKWITGGTAASGYVAAPGSGATIVLWDSGSNETVTGSHFSRGMRWRRIIVNVIASAASAANGLSIEESNDDGANWDVLVQFSISAAAYTKNNVAVSAPRVRVRYTNSANVLTTWRGSVIGDEYDNSSGI